MNRAHGIGMAVMVAAMAVTANLAAAATPNAVSLTRFYPTSLPSSPGGRVDEPEIWYAKVQGLLNAAPLLLQQSLLNSQTTAEFNANIALLQQMQEGLLKQGGRDVRASVAPGRVGAKALGDASNLVFKPLEPCRIMDTRNATAGSGVQGPIAGNSLKLIPGFVTAGSNWGQYGGNASGDCGLANPPGAAIHAVAIVITILDPNFSAYLGVSDVNNLSTVLSNIALNYTGHQGLSTMYIVPQIATNFIYFAMPPQLIANLIFDVVGYYVLSDATALQCTQQASAPVLIANTASGSATSPACAAGYTLTGGSCDSTAAGMSLASHEASGGNTTWFCTANNTSGGSANLTATANCCRVPGK